MEIVELKYLGNNKHLLGTIPQPGQFGDVYDRDTIFVLDGKPIIAHIILEEFLVHRMREMSMRVKPIKTNRVNGIPTQSAVYGAMPRSASRSDYCRFTRQTHDDPQGMAEVVKFGQVICQYYKKYFPQNYDEAMQEISETVHRDWRLSDSPYLTCNFNLNHAIKYHKDSGNYKSHLSNVLILRSGVTGGELVCPDFGITLAQKDRALTIFNGQAVLHGVAPIKRSGTGYRASIVYYTLAGMHKCLCRSDELLRYQDTRTSKELQTTAEVREKVMKMNARLLE